MSIRMMATAVFLALLPVCIADAFDPAPGNRAYPIVGSDILTGQPYNLDDHLGSWVLVCFWSTW